MEGECRGGEGGQKVEEIKGEIVEERVAGALG